MSSNRSPLIRFDNPRFILMSLDEPQGGNHSFCACRAESCGPRVQCLGGRVRFKV